MHQNYKKSFSKYCRLLEEAKSQHESGLGLKVALDTIGEMHDLLLHHKGTYTKEEVNKLTGTSDPYMILGSQERWPLNTHIIEEDGKRVLQILRDFASRELPKNSQEKKNKVLEVLEQLTNIPSLRSGISRSSRLMAIARPDVAFSYNGRSKETLDFLVGIEDSDAQNSKKKLKTMG